MKDNGRRMTGNPAVLKKINTSRVLHYLRFTGPASRAQLARRTGLDAKTLTNLTASLLAAGVIYCRQTVAEGRGRPAEMVAINPDCAYGVGVDLGCQQVTGVVIDLGGVVRRQVREEYEGPKDRKFLLGKARDIIFDLLAGLGRPAAKRVEGLGFCVPGFLERERGVAIESVNISGFKNVPVVEIFTPYVKRPVILEESSRMMTMAELWFGRREAGSHFIGVDLGVGIGMGIVHNGTLYRGSRERSGEIGHTVVEPGGMACGCGKRGCLETVASGRALERFTRELGLSGGAKALFDAAAGGNARAGGVLAKAGEYIGMAVANVINLFDPDRVILNGGLVGAGDLLVEPLRRAVQTHSMVTHGCPVEVSELGALAGAMGAAMLPLNHYFEYENIRFWS